MTPETIKVNAGLPTECIIPANGKSAIKTEEKLGIQGDPPTKEEAVKLLEFIDNFFGENSLYAPMINSLRLYIDTSTPLFCEDEGCDHAGIKHVCTNEQALSRRATIVGEETNPDEGSCDRNGWTGTVIGGAITVSGNEYFVFECDAPDFSMHFVLPKHIKFDTK